MEDGGSRNSKFKGIFFCAFSSPEAKEKFCLQEKRKTEQKYFGHFSLGDECGCRQPATCKHLQQEYPRYETEVTNEGPRSRQARSVWLPISRRTGPVRLPRLTKRHATL